MRNIFELTKREQRVVIFIVVTLVAAAFAKHWLETNPNKYREKSPPVQSPERSATPTQAPRSD